MAVWVRELKDGENVEIIGELLQNGEWNGDVLTRIGGDEEEWMIGKPGEDGIKGILNSDNKISQIWDMHELSIRDIYTDPGPFLLLNDDDTEIFYDSSYQHPKEHLLWRVEELEAGYMLIIERYEHYESPIPHVELLFETFLYPQTQPTKPSTFPRVFLISTATSITLSTSITSSKSPSLTETLTPPCSLCLSPTPSLSLCLTHSASESSLRSLREALPSLSLSSSSVTLSEGPAGRTRRDYVSSTPLWASSSEWDPATSMPSGEGVLVDGNERYEGGLLLGHWHGSGRVDIALHQGLSLWVQTVWEMGQVREGAEVRLGTVPSNGWEVLAGGQHWKGNATHKEYVHALARIRSLEELAMMPYMKIRWGDEEYEGQVEIMKPQGNGVFKSKHYTIEGTFKDGKEVGFCKIYGPSFTSEGLLDNEGSLTEALICYDLRFLFFRYLAIKGEIDFRSELGLTLRSDNLEAIYNASPVKLLSQEKFKELLVLHFGRSSVPNTLKNYGLLYKGSAKRGDTRSELIFDGFGKCVDATGDIYEGNWKDGLYHGFGRLETRGEILEGRWKDGIFMGNDQSPRGGNNQDNYSGDTLEGNINNFIQFNPFINTWRTLSSINIKRLLPITSQRIFKDMIKRRVWRGLSKTLL